MLIKQEELTVNGYYWYKGTEQDMYPATSDPLVVQHYNGLVKYMYYDRMADKGTMRGDFMPLPFPAGSEWVWPSAQTEPEAPEETQDPEPA